MPAPRFPCPLLLAPLLALVSCATPRPQGTDLDAPLFGSAHETTFVVAPGGGMVHAADLAGIARILRRYKTLTEAERALVKSAVGRRLQGLVALEAQRLAPQYEARRAEARRLPDRAAATRHLAELEETLRREATASVLRRLGELVAVPLKTSDNRSAVAFARVGAEGIQVAQDAGEVDRPIAALIEGAELKTATGRMAALLKTGPIAVTAGP